MLRKLLVPISVKPSVTDDTYPSLCKEIEIDTSDSEYIMEYIEDRVRDIVLNSVKAMDYLDSAALGPVEFLTLYYNYMEECHSLDSKYTIPKEIVYQTSVGSSLTLLLKLSPGIEFTTKGDPGKAIHILGILGQYSFKDYLNKKIKDKEVKSDLKEVDSLKNLKKRIDNFYLQ